MMEIISKGYFGLSVILMTTGTILGRILSFVFVDAIHFLQNFDFEYGFVIFLLAIGIPFALLNIFESRYLWGRLLRNDKIDLLGISPGLALGIISIYII